MILMSSLTVILFLGGWLPIFDILLQLDTRTNLVCFKSIGIRSIIRLGTCGYPRYRYDQLMRLGWKIFLPISLGWVLLTAGTLISFNWLPVTNLL